MKFYVRLALALVPILMTAYSAFASGKCEIYDFSSDCSNIPAGKSPVATQSGVSDSAACSAYGKQYLEEHASMSVWCSRWTEMQSKGFVGKVRVHPASKP
jgi:hypothetical protein